MRWARFEREGTPGYGIVEDDLVEAIDGTPFDEWRRTGERHSVAEITWLPPVVPATFYCVGLNYADHIVMEAKLHGQRGVARARVGPGGGTRRPDRRGIGPSHGAQVARAPSRRRPVTRRLQRSAIEGTDS